MEADPELRRRRVVRAEPFPQVRGRREVGHGCGRGHRVRCMITSVLMRVALAQINPISGDIHGNAAKILEAIAAASAARADLVVTPELALPGYCIGDLVEDTAFLEANERALQRIAAAARGHHGGRRLHRLRRRRDATITARSAKYNAAAVVRDGRVLQRAHKSLLPSYRYFDDKRFFTPGERREPVDAGDRRAAVAGRRVDLRRPVGRVLRRQAAARAGRARAPTSCSTSTRRPSIPASGRFASADPPSHRSRSTARSSTSTPSAPPTTARTSSRSTARAWSTTPPGSSIAIGRQFEEDLLVVDLDPAARHEPLRAAADRRRCARSTTRW